MTDILYGWLKDEVKLSKTFDRSSFAVNLASGYYLGEILHKYQLQDDFDKFSSGQTSDAKLNNFTRLEPTLHLLQIPFDSNIAYHIMTMQQGVATRLLYQLYVALKRKESCKLTGAAMETMRAPAPVKLEQIESGLYKERLKTLLPRESDLTLDRVSSKFEMKKRENERRALIEQYKEFEQYEMYKQEQRKAALEKAHIARQKQTELLAKIQAAKVHIPKPPPSKTLKAIAERKNLQRKKEAEFTADEIMKFENNLKNLVSPAVPSQEKVEGNEEDSSGDAESSLEYLERIKTRMQEDATAQEERAKRRRKVLVDQMKAHQAQEEALRQEQVVQRLMRQSQQERRIAVQLLQARQEKDTIRKNRIFLEKQIEERRLKDFNNALDKEAELCRIARQDYEDDIAREKELHAKVMAEQALAKYRKHYEMCSEVLGSIVDFSCKIAEYRELTNKKVPAKFVREWKELLLEGQPLYINNNDTNVDKTENESLLNNQDFKEYQNMVGEWFPDDEFEIKPKPSNNNILGHALHRMFNIVDPIPPPNPPPEFPESPAKLAVLGKMFAGKTTFIDSLCSRHKIVSFSTEQLLGEAVETFMKEDAMQAPTETGEGMEGAESNTIIIEYQTVSDTTLNDSDICNTEAEEIRIAPPMSNLANLGKQAITALRRGQAIPDEVVVNILVEAIRKLPDGTGWVLDAFPQTVEQAVLLEQALTGNTFSIDGVQIGRPTGKKSTLVFDPTPVAAPPPCENGLHCVLAMDVTDELVIKRSCGRTCTEKSNTVYHEEFNPPPNGSRTGILNAEQVSPVVDSSFDAEQVQHRIRDYHENWAKIEPLYSVISNICTVQGEGDAEDVYEVAERQLFQTLEKSQHKEPEPAPPVVEETPVVEPPPPPPPAPKEEPRPESSSSKGRRSKSTDSKGSKSSRGRKKSADKEKGGKSRSRSGSKGGKKGKKSRDPTPEPEPEPVVDLGPPKPQPGEPDWVYVNEDIHPTIVKFLVSYWDCSEANYIETCKHIFAQIRCEREDIVRYLYEVAQNFQEFLRRPDSKQPFLHSWQKDYNNVSEDLREDEETKAELHQRVDNLCERLWDICDAKKEESEKERMSMKTEGWVEDHLGVLTNYYLMLLQTELDRFQGTLHVLRDYYTGMNAKTPAEIDAVTSFTRLPLVNMNVQSQDGQDLSANASVLTVNSDNHPISPQTSHQSDGQDVGAAESRTKIPLVQRGAPIAIATDDGGKGKKGKAPPPQPDSPTQDDKAEEKTISEAFNFSLHAVTTGVQTYINDKDAEEEEELRLKEEAEKAKLAAAIPDKAAKGGKKGGGKSAKGKKGGKKSKTPTPTPPTPVEETPEDIEKKAAAAKMKEEYFIALRQEENRVKNRLELIKYRACSTLSSLRSMTDKVFQDLLSWLEARYLGEMAAIDNLSTIAKQHIESCETIKYELRLDQDDFFLNTELKLIADPVPPPRPPPVETQARDVFTVVQLFKLHADFKNTAPSGIMSKKAFQDVLSDAGSLSHGSGALPDAWLNISPLQLSELCTLLSPNSNYVDWKKFLLLASQPWTYPTVEQLLELRTKYKEIDTAGNGWITQAQYDQVSLWFSCGERPESPDDPLEPYPYDRNENLRQFFFAMFADWQQTEPRLDYINMLMYFGMDTDPIVGFFNALGIASGTVMPQLVNAKEKLVTPTENTDIMTLPENDPAMQFACIYRGAKIVLQSQPVANVAPQSWWLTLHHGTPKLGDCHRFSMSEDPDDAFSMEHICEVYQEMGATDVMNLPVDILMRHLVLQDAVNKTRRFHYPDIKSIFFHTPLDADDQQSEREA